MTRWCVHLPRWSTHLTRRCVDLPRRCARLTWRSIHLSRRNSSLSRRNLRLTCWNPGLSRRNIGWFNLGLSRAGTRFNRRGRFDNRGLRFGWRDGFGRWRAENAQAAQRARDCRANSFDRYFGGIEWTLRRNVRLQQKRVERERTNQQRRDRGSGQDEPTPQKTRAPAVAKLRTVRRKNRLCARKRRDRRRN